MKSVKKNSGFDALETRVVQILQNYRKALLEIENLKETLATAQAEPVQTEDPRDAVIAEKDEIIRRLQQVLKKKEESFDELQDAFNSQKKKIEKYESGEASFAGEKENIEIQKKLESALSKLNELETMLNPV